jgi:L-asparaginase
MTKPGKVGSRKPGVPKRPRIAVFSTGGTIASVSTDDSTATPRLTAEDLLSAVPQLREIGDLEGVGFRQLASSELTVADMIALAHEIGRTTANGVVVTQGTDTLEETAFALDLLWDGETPVVLTGAMRNPALPGADGPANLLAAALVAASPMARGLGALVVFNDEVHLPLFVRKTHTTNRRPFVPSSPVRSAGSWKAARASRCARRCGIISASPACLK